MTTYEPLCRHLRNLDSHRWQPSFIEIEALIDATWSPSARRDPVWMENGDVTAETVIFGRTGW